MHPRAARPEIGWLDRPIALGGDGAAAPGRAAADAGRAVPGPFFAWHEDAFTVPPGATELARTAAGPQAIAHGRSLALQFHPEVDEVIVEAWLAGARDAVPDPEPIRAETAAHGGDGPRARLRADGPHRGPLAALKLRHTSIK